MAKNDTDEDDIDSPEAVAALLDPEIVQRRLRILQSARLRAVTWQYWEVSTPTQHSGCHRRSTHGDVQTQMTDNPSPQPLGR